MFYTLQYDTNNLINTPCSIVRYHSKSIFYNNTFIILGLSPIPQTITFLLRVVLMTVCSCHFPLSQPKLNNTFKNISHKLTYIVICRLHGTLHYYYYYVNSIIIRYSTHPTKQTWHCLYIEISIYCYTITNYVLTKSLS